MRMGGIVMQATSQCCTSASSADVGISDDPFSQVVVLDYYDGPASGFVKCKVCGTEYHFYMLDWDESHLVRIFALARVPAGSMQRLFDVFQATPDRHVWIPPVFRRASEETLSDLYNRGIQDIIDHAASPNAVIAWSVRTEKSLAMRGIEAAAASHLLPWFERESLSDGFDWFGYLRVAKPWQPA